MTYSNIFYGSCCSISVAWDHAAKDAETIRLSHTWIMEESKEAQTEQKKTQIFKKLTKLQEFG